MRGLRSPELRHPGLRGMGRACLLAPLLAGLALQAGAVDVSQLADIESDPCFQQVHGRELDAHLGAIESQIVTACTDAHGNPTAAMALLTERMKAPPWLPPAAGGMSAAAVLLAALAQLAAIVALLAVGVGYAPRALGLRPPGAGLAAGILAARLAAALLLTVLLVLPGLSLIGGIGLFAVAMRVCRWPGPVPATAATASQSGVAQTVALLGTDLLGNAAVSVGIAAVSRGSLVLAAGGVLAAALVPRLLHPALTRLLLARPVCALVAGALVAWIAGRAAALDPALGTVPPLVSWLAPFVLAGLAVGATRGRGAGRRLAGGAPGA